MRVAIHQPNLFPRLKVLQKLAAADVWVVLDSVQYCDREWQNRARIVPAHGESTGHWLTVPVSRRNGQKTLIRDVTVVAPDTTPGLVQNTLLHAFRQAPHWRDVSEYLETVRADLATMDLVQLCTRTTGELLRTVGRKPDILLSSTLSVSGQGSQLMSEICRRLRADTYLADSGAGNYLRLEDFSGTSVLWQNWMEPATHCDRITSWRNLSCLNYLSRVGAEQLQTHLLDACFRSRALNVHETIEGR